MPRGGLDAELASVARSRARLPGIGALNRKEEGGNCKLSSRFIVLVSSLCALALSFALLIAPAVRSEYADGWVLASVTCPELANQTVVEAYTDAAEQTANSDSLAYTDSAGVVYGANEAINSLRSRFRAIVAMAFLNLFSGLLGLVTSVTPDLQADASRCRMVTFICFSLPSSIASAFVSLYCFGFRKQANYIARVHFECLQPYLPPRMAARPEDVSLDAELLLAGYLLLFGAVCLTLCAYCGGNMLGWRRISRATMLACNSVACAAGGAITVVALVSLGAAEPAAELRPGDFLVAAFGLLIASLSVLGLAAARKESVRLCKAYARATALVTALCLGVCILFFLYPEAIDLFLISHWSGLQRALGGMSKREYDQLTAENATFIGMLMTVLCTLLVLNALAAFTYRHELERGSRPRFEPVEFVDITKRRKLREADFRAHLAEEGAARQTAAAAEAAMSRAREHAPTTTSEPQAPTRSSASGAAGRFSRFRAGGVRR